MDIILNLQHNRHSPQLHAYNALYWKKYTRIYSGQIVIPRQHPFITFNCVIQIHVTELNNMFDF